MKTHAMSWPKIIKKMFFLLGISTILALSVNFFSPAGIPVVGQWDEGPAVSARKTKSHVFSGELEIKHVKIAKEIYDNGKVVFVDARSLDDFQAGHIKGAKPLPLGQFENFIGVFKAQHPVDTFIVTYCSGRACDDSHRLEQRLFDNGYVNVSVFIDGYPAWKAKGYPIE